jgi:hypothetical protein
MSVPPVARLTKNQLDRRNVWSGTYELNSYYRQHQRRFEVSNKKVQRISGMSQFSPVSLKRFSKHSGMMSMLSPSRVGSRSKFFDKDRMCQTLSGHSKNTAQHLPMISFSPVSLKRFLKCSGRPVMFCLPLESVQSLNFTIASLCVRSFLEKSKCPLLASMFLPQQRQCSCFYYLSSTLRAPQ